MATKQKSKSGAKRATASRPEETRQERYERKVAARRQAVLERRGLR